MITIYNVADVPRLDERPPREVGGVAPDAGFGLPAAVSRGLGRGRVAEGGGVLARGEVGQAALQLRGVEAERGADHGGEARPPGAGDGAPLLDLAVNLPWCRHTD